MSRDYQRLRQYLDAPPARPVPRRRDFDALMHQCEEGPLSEDRPSTESVLEFFPDGVDQTQAAVLALSLFIDWLNRLPSSRPEFEGFPGLPHEEYPLEWIFHDLRFSPRAPRSEGRMVYWDFPRRPSYHRTVTEYLDLRLNEILDDLRVSPEGLPAGLPATLQEADEVGYLSYGYDEHVPMAQELAALGINSLIHATNLIFREGPALEVLEWNMMAVEALAWSWQFLNAPFGGSRAQNAISRLGWGRLEEDLRHDGIVYFRDSGSAETWWDDPDQASYLMSVWDGPGWYDTSENRFIAQNLPVYLALEELVHNPFYYQQFYKRWYELVGCRWPVARWKPIDE